MKMRYFATSVDSNIYGSDGKSNFTRDLKSRWGKIWTTQGAMSPFYHI